MLARFVACLAGLFVIVSCSETNQARSRAEFETACSNSFVSSHLDAQVLSKIRPPLYFETFEGGEEAYQGCPIDCQDIAHNLSLSASSTFSAVVSKKSSSQATTAQARMDRVDLDSLQSVPFATFRNTTWIYPYEWGVQPGWWLVEIADEAACHAQNWRRDAESIILKYPDRSGGYVCLQTGLTDPPRDLDTRFQTFSENTPIPGDDRCFIRTQRFVVTQAGRSLSETSQVRLQCHGSSGGAGFEDCPVSSRAPDGNALLSLIKFAE